MIAKREQRLWGVATALCILIALAPVAAAEGPGGTGPDDAMTPTGEWEVLKAGDVHWYRFHTEGADEDGKVAQINIEMQATPVNAVSFAVWTAEELHRKAAAGPDETVEPIGRGSAVPLDELGFVQKSTWSGGFVMGGDYYVVVEQSGQRPAGYAIKIAGEKVTFPGPVVQPKVVSPQPETRSLVSAKAGTGPDDAFTATGDWKALKQGEGHWYVFQTRGADIDGNTPRITIELESTPPGSANFCVWTPEGLRVWSTGTVDEFTLPVGRSSALTLDEGGVMERAVWSGEFNVGGPYYVCVRQVGPYTTNYSLQITLR